MEERKSIISKLFDRVKESFSNQEAQVSHDLSSQSLPSGEINNVFLDSIPENMDFDTMYDPEIDDRYFLDPEEQEYDYPDDFVSEVDPVFLGDDIQRQNVFDSSIINLAKDIEDYLNTYASLPVLPFGAMEEKREEWIQAFGNDLVINHGEWCKKEIYDTLNPLGNIESPEIKEIAQKLLYRIEQLELNSRETGNKERSKEKKPMKEVFSEATKKSEMYEKERFAEQVGWSGVLKKTEKDNSISID